MNSFNLHRFNSLLETNWTSTAKTLKQRRMKINYLAIDVTNWQIEAHDFIADEQLHASVVLQQRHQLAILTDFVLDVAHQRTQSRFGAAVRIALHPTCTNQFQNSFAFSNVSCQFESCPLQERNEINALKEIFLLGVLVEREEELGVVLLFWMNDGAQSLDDEDGRHQIVAEALTQRLDADGHELLGFGLGARCHVAEELQQQLLSLLHQPRPLQHQSA